MAEKYNWFFLSLRPGDGLAVYNTKSLYDWFVKHSTSLFIIREKEGNASHWHICLCWNNDITRSNFQSLYQKTLRSLWEFNDNQIRVNTTGKAIQIMYNMDVINSYLSGNYHNEWKDKRQDEMEILHNFIDDNDYVKIKPIVATNNKTIRKEKCIDKILSYVEENNIDIMKNESALDVLFNTLYAKEIISIPFNKFQEETYKLIIFNKLTDFVLVEKVVKLQDLTKYWKCHKILWGKVLETKASELSYDI